MVRRSLREEGPLEGDRPSATVLIVCAALPDSLIVYSFCINRFNQISDLCISV